MAEAETALAKASRLLVTPEPFIAWLRTLPQDEPLDTCAAMPDEHLHCPVRRFLYLAHALDMDILSSTTYLSDDVWRDADRGVPHRIWLGDFIREVDITCRCWGSFTPKQLLDILYY